MRRTSSQLRGLAAVVAIGGSACSSSGTANSTDPHGTVACRINGETFSASGEEVVAVRTGGMLEVSASGTQSAVTFSTSAHSVGTFPFGGLDESSGRVQIITSTWQAVGAGSGQIVITSFTDSSAAGTFAFTASPVASTGAVNTKMVTDGNFIVSF